MGRLYDTLRQLRLWSQPAVYVGAVMVAAIWLSFTFHLAVEHDRSLSAAVQNTGNLARVFEEHIVRTLMEADRAIVLLRRSYQVNGNFDLANSFANFPEENLIAEIRVIGPDGLVIASATRPISAPVNSSDREYFQVQ